MKTKAQELGITDFPYKEYDKNVNLTYHETSYNYWEKYEYDKDGNNTLIEWHGGGWSRWKYDNKGNPDYFEESTGYKEYFII